MTQRIHSDDMPIDQPRRTHDINMHEPCAYAHLSSAGKHDYADSYATHATRDAMLRLARLNKDLHLDSRLACCKPRSAA